MNINNQTPTRSFAYASWIALLLGTTAYLIGLWNADIDLSQRGYHLTLVFYGLFSVITLQKSVRDRDEGIPITDLYYGLSWASTMIAIILLAVALWNADLWLSEKGFYAMAYALSIFGAIAVGKNVRDLAASKTGSLEARARRSRPTIGSDAQDSTRDDAQDDTIVLSRDSKRNTTSLTTPRRAA